MRVTRGEISERLERGGHCWLLKVLNWELRTQRTNKRGPSLVGLMGVSCRYRDFYSALAQYKIFFSLAVHYFNSFVPIAQQAGQAAVLDRLSLSMSLWEGWASENQPEAVWWVQRGGNITRRVIIRYKRGEAGNQDIFDKQGVRSQYEVR